MKLRLLTHSYRITPLLERDCPNRFSFSVFYLPQQTKTFLAAKMNGNANNTTGATGKTYQVNITNKTTSFYSALARWFTVIDVSLVHFDLTTDLVFT